MNTFTPPTRSRSPLGRALLALLATLFIAGCGDSQEDYVFTNTNNPNNPATTGNLTFHFVQAQANFNIVAPLGTTDIRFELYDGPNGTGELVETVTRQFSAAITLEDVPVEVVSTVLTFYDDNGIPVREVVVSTPVSAGQTVDVNPSGSQSSTPTFEALTATPASLGVTLNQTANISVVASFSNGDDVVLTGNTEVGLTYTPSPAGVATVSNAGVVTGVTAGNTTVTVSLEANDAVRSDTVEVTVTGLLDRLEVSPSTVTLFENETATLTVEGFDANDDPVALDSGDYTVESADEDVASVSGNVITAGEIGNTTVTVTASGDDTISQTVTVNVVEGLATGFEGFNEGSINGQQGWVETNNTYDVEVENVTRTEAAFADFGDRALRISNAVTSGGFDWVYGPGLETGVGETRAVPTGTPRNDVFDLSFDFATTVATEQEGLQISLSPDSGVGGRMSYLRFEDRDDGIAIVFFDYDGVTLNDFRSEDVATGLSRAVPHHVRLTLNTVEGASNDVVGVYVDGTLVHTGTSWEDYYADVNTEPTFPNPPLVTTILLQARTSAGEAPGTLGQGYYFNNFRYSTTEAP